MGDTGRRADGAGRGGSRVRDGPGGRGRVRPRRSGRPLLGAGPRHRQNLRDADGRSPPPRRRSISSPELSARVSATPENLNGDDQRSAEPGARYRKRLHIDG